MQALFTFSQKRYEIILKSNLTFGNRNGLFKSISLYWYPLPISGRGPLRSCLLFLKMDVKESVLNPFKINL
jgi:hypothetical protein